MTKSIQWGKGIKLDHFRTTLTKINSKWIKDLNLRLETMKILKENIGSMLFDISLSNIFLYLSIQTREIKTKINKWALIKAMETLNKTKRQLTEWEKIFASESADKGLISKIHKQPIELMSKQNNSPVEKWAEDVNRHFSKEDIQMTNKNIKKIFQYH